MLNLATEQAMSVKATPLTPSHPYRGVEVGPRRPRDRGSHTRRGSRSRSATGHVGVGQLEPVPTSVAGFTYS
jgi:hypothetical protein